MFRKAVFEEDLGFIMVLSEINGMLMGFIALN